MSGAPVVVRLRGAGRRFGQHHAVRGVDLEVRAGERVALLGASGAGKSTLLSLADGGLAATSGTVEVLGHDLGRLRGARLRAVQRRVGTISQELALIEQVRVLHNVGAGRLGRVSTGRALASLVWPGPLDEVREALDRVDLGWALHERTERLSGGERQRVAIARLLVQGPSLVLADEPVSHLDPGHAARALRLLTGGTPAHTVVMSLHQPLLAREHCTRVVGLREGEVVLDLPAHEASDALLRDLYEQP